jgi:phage host-nuclease inhibitor protein Gam
MALVRRSCRSHERATEAPIDHQDVTTIMGLLGDMQRDIDRIRELLEGELGEE